MAATERTHAWPVRTIGVDLAAQPGDTGVAVIEWNESGAKVAHLSPGLKGGGTDTSAWNSADEEILRLARTAAVVGIDVPFGWPITFERFLRGDPNPLDELGASAGDPPVPGDPDWRRLLQFRRTELLVRQHPDFGIWPMSVTSNKIAVTAMRASVLLAKLEQEERHPDRDGSGDIVEVYPAAALKKWGPLHKGYKGKKGARKRHSVGRGSVRSGQAGRLAEAE